MIQIIKNYVSRNEQGNSQLDISKNFKVLIGHYWFDAFKSPKKIGDTHCQVGSIIAATHIQSQ